MLKLMLNTYSLYLLVPFVFEDRSFPVFFLTSNAHTCLSVLPRPANIQTRREHSVRECSSYW